MPWRRCRTNPVERSGGAASIGFHLLHVAGSLDRLLTDAHDTLNAAQTVALCDEGRDGSPEARTEALVQAAHNAIDRARRARSHDFALHPRRDPARRPCGSALHGARPAVSRRGACATPLGTNHYNGEGPQENQQQ
jgi:hypothetical protein